MGHITSLSYAAFLASFPNLIGERYPIPVASFLYQLIKAKITVLASSRVLKASAIDELFFQVMPKVTRP
jgi:hypothetical protein